MLVFRIASIVAAAGCFSAHFAWASSGDRSFEFQDCLAGCDSAICANPPSLSLPLRLTLWSCADDCKYHCTHVVTDRALERVPQEPVQQFYGKWPFWRLWGMQEPASVAFSLLNLWAHLRGFRDVRRRIPPTNPLRGYIMAWSLLSVNLWVWSSVFHTRDKSTTEKLDYFSAALAILYSLFYAVLRLFHLYMPSDPRSLRRTSRAKTHGWILRLWATTCALLYIAHVSYLSALPRFDYAYNIRANLGIGLTHHALWLCYSFPRLSPFRLQNHPKRPSKRPALLVLLTTCATCLELFDFPAWHRAIDAHALWHLSTAPIVTLWYQFLIGDALAMEEGHAQSMLKM
ncbi:hypothetical protein BOTBODRAFT_127592 [Botryobasidium botryosum FD-172 SS1]|uniref:Post-GPI attachment to proteins factor 3 n=1 Tax=Botryobasidium botryosum (strain FD-172 SS1) TaxID=930990 RepID=A0A067N3G6_BOTB1|nr:hypothetical protein BOTBODRAFT_127592 [Botryobasidium botryosum FD-172 SS1]